MCWPSQVNWCDGRVLHLWMTGDVEYRCESGLDARNVLSGQHVLVKLGEQVQTQSEI